MSKLFLSQFERSRNLLEETLTNVDPKIFEIIPRGFNNNIHWQIGHILIITDWFLFNGNERYLERYQAFFAPGTKPSDWSDNVPTVEEILACLREQREQILQRNVSDFEDLLVEALLGNKTVGEFIAMGAHHEAVHIGQIQSLKRAAESI